MDKRIIKCSATQRRTHEGKHRFEHWYVDNQVYFITGRCAGKHPAFATSEASTVFWDRFDHYTAKHLFTPWVTSLVATHYHVLGYCKDGKMLGQMMRRIVIPQALRFAIPPTGNEFIAMLKDSALVSATGFVHELMWRATRVGRAQFNNLEALIIAAIFYWIMTLIFTALQSRLEAYMSRGER